MNWFGGLKQTVEDVAVRKNTRSFTGKVEPGKVENDSLGSSVKGDKFVPERSYFSVRIVEMRLSEAGRYFSEFVPMCSCFLRYTYGRSQRTVPFVLGRETISAGLGKDVSTSAASNIQFRNMYVVRNVPVKADNLLMFSALCRFKDSGFARGLLDLLSDAAATVGGPAVGAIAKTGVDLTNRLGTLLGADGVETRFGMLNGNALDNSGYQVFAGIPAADMHSGELVMRDGQLLRSVQGGPTVTIDNADYLVLALEHRATLIEDSFGQVSILPFHDRWEEVRTKLLQTDKDGADQALKALMVEIGSSPDVTEADRLALIVSYRSAFDQWSGIGSHGPTMGFEPSRIGKLPRNVTALLGAVRATAAKATAKDEGSIKAIFEDPAALNTLLAQRAGIGTKAMEAAGTSEAGIAQLQKASTALLSAVLSPN